MAGKGNNVCQGQQSTLLAAITSSAFDPTAFATPPPLSSIEYPPTASSSRGKIDPSDETWGSATASSPRLGKRRTFLHVSLIPFSGLLYIMPGTIHERGKWRPECEERKNLAALRSIGGREPDPHCRHETKDRLVFAPIVLPLRDFGDD